MQEFSMEELMPLLKELTERYTHKESTSVPYEKARQLMEAILYCMEADDMAGDDIAGAFTDKDSTGVREVNEDVRAVWQSGCARVVEKTRKARQIYDRIIQSFHDYGNRTFHDTVTGGLSGFFLYYDPVFMPQEHIITMDYPVLADLSGMCGIHVIYRYLTCISYDQQFLSGLPLRYVQEALRRYHHDYKELIINLASVVLRDCLLRAMGSLAQDTEGVSDRTLQLEPAVGYCREHGVEALESHLHQLLDLVMKSGYPGLDDLHEYLKLDIHPFAVEISAAAGG